MENQPLFADIIVPISLKGTFTYVIPGEIRDEIKVGMRVMVQFGKNKLYAGIVRQIHGNSPADFKLKPVLSVLDDHPIFQEVHMRFWDWVASYYMCPIGDVMHAALPHGLRLQSETVFRPVREQADTEQLTQEEELLLELIWNEHSMSLDEIRNSPFGLHGARLARRLHDRGILRTGQHLKEKYTPKTVQCIDLDAQYLEETVLVQLMEGMQRAPAQLKALEVFVRLSERFLNTGRQRTVSIKELRSEGVSDSAIRGLVKKGVFFTYNVEVSRLLQDQADGQLSLPATLTKVQQKALDRIRNLHQKLPVVLLHGVTSSGKTEIYVHLIEEQLKQGKQVLYLMPEIGITSQIITRLRKVFDDRVGVYHSKYSDAERVELFLNISGNQRGSSIDIVLGVRSALFLPFRKLGMIIIDEEHEHTFKQSDPAPRYHARDSAIINGVYHQAKVLLGSATPSFESMHNARTGKFGLVELRNRYGDIEMPEVVIANVRQAKKRKAMRSHFTPELLKALDETLALGKQAIFFQNRRGYSNYLQCQECGFILKCTQCDVSMTYHKYNREMVCHYCGVKAPVPNTCKECHQSSLLMKGFGTEKIEDELGLIYPELSIARLDLDRITTRRGFERVMNEFESGKVQVLIGTQLVTKGLDFDNVHLVGVIDADSMMHFPDFRAFERSLQVLMQVSGRSGRRKTRGKVVIQTSDPDHPVIGHLLQNQYVAFYTEQMEERQVFRYPPFVRMIKIVLRHEIEPILDGGAIFLAGELKEIFGNRVLGPQQPVVARTHGKYIKQIYLKIEKASSFERARQLTGELIDVFVMNPVYKQIRITVDVDPLS